MKKTTTISADDRLRLKADVLEAERAKLPCAHPMHYNVGGPALREVVVAGRKAAGRLERAGMLQEVLAEVDEDIFRQAMASLGSRTRFAEQDVARLERELANARDRLQLAKQDEMSFSLKADRGATP